MFESFVYFDAISNTNKTKKATATFFIFIKILYKLQYS